MAEDYGWTTAQWGILGGSLPWGIALVVLFIGLIQDAWSPRKLMAAALLLLGVVMALRGVVSSFVLALIVILLSGVASSVFETGNLKLMTTWFDRRQTAQITGILFTGIAAGYFFGLTLSMWLTNLLGSWQAQFIAIGAFIFIGAAIFLFGVPEKNNSELDDDLQISEDRRNRSMAEGIKQTLTSAQAIRSILTEMSDSAIIFAFSTIGPLAFAHLWDCSQAHANFIVSSSSLFGIVAYTLMPMLYNKIQKRKPTGIPALIVSTTIYFTSLFYKHDVIAFILIGCAGSLNGWGLVAPRLLMIEHPDIAGVNTGTATGIFFMLSKLTQGVVPTLFVAFTAMCHGNEGLGWTCVWIIAYIGIIPLFFQKDTGLKSKWTLEHQAEIAAAGPKE